jgi:hypothetical protein
MPSKKKNNKMSSVASSSALTVIAKNSADQLSAFPKPFLQYPVFNMTFEFNGTFTTPIAVTRGTVRKMLFMDISATTGFQIINSAKVNLVEIWSQNTTVPNQFSTVGIEWSTPNTFAKVKLDSGNSQRPAHVQSRPPRNSPASFPGLLGQDGDTLFRLFADSPSLIRINVSFTMFAGGGAGIAGSGGNAGMISYNALANNCLSTNQDAGTASVWT